MAFIQAVHTTSPEIQMYLDSFKTQGLKHLADVTKNKPYSSVNLKNVFLKSAFFTQLYQCFTFSIAISPQ